MTQTQAQGGTAVTEREPLLEIDNLSVTFKHRRSQTRAVVRRPGSELTGEQVMDFVAERVAPHEKVRAVTFIDAIPKSTSGKILRRDLKGR